MGVGHKVGSTRDSAAHAGRDEAAVPGASSPRGLIAWVNRPVVAGAALLAVYLLLSMFMDPRGFLGTDTGGKVATLEVMTANDTLNPDIGYWAEEFDPDGEFHPMWYTHTFDDNWIQLSTLPMVYAGLPLYELGGYRLALLLPMAGGVAAAYAAAALARRFGAKSPWSAFWLVGLASPVAIYALDFWEHSIGVALMGWGIVFLIDVADKGRWPKALAAGFLFGVAGTMRTEALVYVLAVTAVVCLSIVITSRRLGRAVASGLAVVVGFAGPMVANAMIEKAVLGSAARADRSVRVVGRAGEAMALRAEEAVTTALSIQPSVAARNMFIGVVLAVLLVVVATKGTSRAGAQLARLAAGGVAAVFLIRALEGPGFVPGMLATTPIAVVGLVHGWRNRSSRLACIAVLLALPMVWMFQFTGGAGPQWGGRYILVTGFVLLVAGVATLDRLLPFAARFFVLLSVAVTVFGLVWLSQRSNDVAAAQEALVELDADVLITDVAHLPREGGAFYLDRLWLTAVFPGDLEGAVGVVEEAGYDSLGFVEVERSRPAPSIAGWQSTGEASVTFISGVPLRVTFYEPVAGG